ncbi:MAG: hypothetical protein D6712_09725 [Chloroflexi bacterium]|nr:MAG: hypothetical protein D6712_09725 [Chloroflexota bacterium]
MMIHIIHISDTHIHSDPTYCGQYGDYPALHGAQVLVERLQTLPFQPNFILHTGDVIVDPIPELYATARDVFAPLSVPIHYLPGNHDHKTAFQRDLLGLPPDAVRPMYYQEFDYQGVQFVFLDSNGGAEPPRGYVDDDQLAWLEAICTAEDTRPLVVAVHHNILPTGVPWLDDFMGTTNGADVHAVLRRAAHRLRGVFHGHIHQDFEIEQDGVRYYGVPSSWCQFRADPDQIETVKDVDSIAGYNIISISSSQTIIRRMRYQVNWP